MRPEPSAVARAARLINEAQKPVIVAGQGISIARAEKELRQLAERANIPVATSLLGIGNAQTSSRTRNLPAHSSCRCRSPRCPYGTGR